MVGGSKMFIVSKTSTGLGLSIAKIICDRIGGEITAAKKGNRLEIALRL